MTMYTSMLDVSIRDKNLKVSELEIDRNLQHGQLNAYMLWHEHVISIFIAYYIACIVYKHMLSVYSLTKLGEIN